LVVRRVWRAPAGVASSLDQIGIHAFCGANGSGAGAPAGLATGVPCRETACR